MIILENMYRVGHPEYFAEAKRLGLTNREYYLKLLDEGVLPNPVDINRKDLVKKLDNARCKDLKEYKNKCAQRRGFRCYNECQQEWRHNKGIQLPIFENKDCSSYLGVYIIERKVAKYVLPIIISDIEKEMPYGNHGYDFVCKEDIKVEVKARCLCLKNDSYVLDYNISYNNIADYFMLVAIDNRVDINILHIWLIKKDDIIRGEKFYNRNSISITNKNRYLLPFKIYDHIDRLDRSKLKELCEEFKDNL